MLGGSNYISLVCKWNAKQFLSLCTLQILVRFVRLTGTYCRILLLTTVNQQNINRYNWMFSIFSVLTYYFNWSVILTSILFIFTVIDHTVPTVLTLHLRSSTTQRKCWFCVFNYLLFITVLHYNICSLGLLRKTTLRVVKYKI